jgi:nanoRNase/pAp phosphatase (c-di-AMP/oligoRNAs hydrolase)
VKKLSFEELAETVKGLAGKRALLSFHSVGDTDSVSSAFGMALLLKNSKIASPDIITANSRRILETFGFNGDSVTTAFDDSVDVVVLLDVNNFEDCGQFAQKLRDFKGDIVIIDHHVQSRIDKEQVYVYNDEAYTSTAGIVYALTVSLGIKPEIGMAKLLAAGIISDSAEFRNATDTTFTQIGSLLSTAGVDYPTLSSEITHISDPAARMMTMKDIQGATIDVVQGLLFVHGSAHAHANIAADHAMKLGADVALFSSENEREISFSARLRAPLDKELGIHLGQIMKRLGPLINGSGGGHPCAAGAYGPLKGQAFDFAERFIEEVTSRVTPI